MTLQPVPGQAQITSISNLLASPPWLSWFNLVRDAINNGVYANLDVFTPYIGISSILPTPNTASPTTIGCAIIAAGTLTAVPITSTNLFTGTVRNNVVSAAGANSAATYRVTQALCLIGAAAGEGGFNFVSKFGVEVNCAVSKGAFGMRDTLAAIGSVQPSSLTNIIMAGWDSTDTTLQIMHNDSSGSCTKIDLGANFPVNTSATDLYQLEFNCASNASSISYFVTRLNTGHTASGSLSSNLPANTTLFAPMYWLNNGATASAVTLATFGSWIGRPH